ncbi:MAG: hypothetical protein QM602_05695 [Microbacterium sp.]
MDFLQDRPRSRVPPFAALGLPVIALGSVGMTVWGGLRVGWIRSDLDTLRRSRDALREGISRVITQWQVPLPHGGVAQAWSEVAAGVPGERLDAVV